MGLDIFSYIFTLLGCSMDASHIDMNIGDFLGVVDIELKGDGAMDIYDDALVITYLHEI